MTTPTAKELFLAAWQAKLSQHDGAHEHFNTREDDTHWERVWLDCIRVAAVVAVPHVHKFKRDGDIDRCEDCLMGQVDGPDV